MKATKMPSSLETSHAYIGRVIEATEHHEAGEVVCAAVDHPGHKKGTAKEIAKWIEDGLVIERVPIEWAREHFGSAAPYP